MGSADCAAGQRNLDRSLTGQLGELAGGEVYHSQADGRIVSEILVLLSVQFGIIAR